MKRRNNVVILIVALLLTIFVGGFWVWGYNHKKVEINELQNKIENQEQAVVDENSLVWYEVPELGIRFKATQDTKEDLADNFISYNNNKYLNAKLFDNQFYSSLEVIEKTCDMRSIEKSGCHLFNMTMIDKNNTNDYKNINEIEKNDDIYILFDDNADLIYISGEIVSYLENGVLTKQGYNKAFGLEKTDRNKNFGINFNIIETIDYENYCPKNYSYNNECSLNNGQIQNRKDYLFFRYSLFGEDLGFGYKMYKNKIYHWDPNPQSVATMSSLDVNSYIFQVIDGKMSGSFVVDAYGKDDKKVFMGNFEINKADPETFELLKYNEQITQFSKDKNFVFCGSRMIKEADRVTFRIFKSNAGYMAQDKLNCYNSGGFVVDYERCFEHK